MSLLETYLTNEEEAGNTITQLNTLLSHHMRVIKEEAESLDYRCLVDEAFQHEIASLCLSVQTLREHVAEAELGIERFIQNSYKKWALYLQLQQDFLCLLTAKTIEGMTRMHKLDRSSSFNVIKVNTHYIEISHINKALVLPSPVVVATAPVVNTPNTEAPVVTKLEIFQNEASLELVRERANQLKTRFAEIEHKKGIYQRHYELLGNRSFLLDQHRLLRQKMEDVAYYIEHNVLMQDEDSILTKSTIRAQIEQVNKCFEGMLDILTKERVNCKAYMLNTITRFDECSLTYKKLKAHLTLNKVLIDSPLTKPASNSGSRLLSMYVHIDETIV